MAEGSATGMPSAEAEVMMSPTILELLLPPLVCLAFICAGLIIWTMRNRSRSKKKTPSHHPRDLKITNPDQHNNKIYPSEDLQKDIGNFTISDEKDNMIFTLRPKSWLKEPTKTKDSVSVPPLFRDADFDLIDDVYDRGPTNVRELAYILMPVVFTLGFCPLTLLLHEPLVKCLWPPHVFSSPPNINDAIACFLVPAGMVYAISFGFAFQQVSGGFRETEVGVIYQAAQLTKVLNLVKNLTVIPPATRLAMVRVIKDVTLTSLSWLRRRNNPSQGDVSEGVEDLLRLLYSCKLTAGTNVKDTDPWQRSLYQRLEKLLTADDFLSCNLPKTRIHLLEWAFLVTLGYFTFAGVLLVQTSSYRTNLAFCLLTVISISLLCYLVADLDSPFHGFFRVPLGDFRLLTERLENDFNRAAAEVMLEKSFVDMPATN